MNATDSAEAVAALQEAQKGFDERAARRSVVAPRTPEEGQFAPGYELGNLMLWVGGQADEIEPWGRNVKRRDRQLREFIPTENVFASALGTIVARNAAFDFSVEGPPRTASRVHDILENANNGKGWVDFVSKVSYDLYCLAGPSRVRLGGARLGQTKTIAQMVRQRDAGPVISVGPEGLTERYVTDWHATPLGNRTWIWLTLRHSRHAGRGRGGLFLTNDHPVLTADGWLSAGSVRPGMRVATEHGVPNPSQAAFVVGTLLGDGHVNRRLRGLSLVHSRKHADWLAEKKKALAGITWTDWQTSRDTGARARSSPVWTEWGGRWYPEGKKRIDRIAVRRYWSDILLAAWYCDDGSLARSYARKGNETRPGAFLSTQGLDDDDVAWLATELNERGFIASDHPVHWRTGRGHRIYIGADGAEKLFAMIGRFVPPSLRHKLPPTAPRFDEEAWNLGRAQPYFDEVIEARPRPYHQAGRVVQTTYHLGVEGTRNFVAAGMVVHNTQDSGAFFEIVRDGDAENAPLVGINHLDASRCWHTGIPQEPVLYQDRLGRYHLLKAHQVQTLADLPVPHETLYGLQLCGLTRLLRACQIIKAINQYKYEKVSGRHTRAIHFIRGVPTAQITAALAQMNIAADQAGLSKYLQPIMIGTVDPAVDLQTATIEFLSLPDGYDEETTFKHYISQIALALQEDYQTFAPLPGGNLGTSAQSQILHQKGQGKGPALFMKLFATAFNQNVLPQNVEFAWKEQDVEAEKKEAEVKALRATTRQVRIASGEITPEVARQIAKDEGDLDGVYLEALGQQDVTEDVELEDDRPVEAQIDEDQAGGAGALQSAQPANQPSQPPPAGAQAPTPAQLQAVADAIKAFSPLLLRNVAEGRKVQLGAFLQTRIHRAFTTAADDLAALGYMDTAGRILLSHIIGDTLGTFARLVDEEAAEIALAELDHHDVRELVEQAGKILDLGTPRLFHLRLKRDLGQLSPGEVLELVDEEKALENRATGMETAAERLPVEEEVASKIGPLLDFVRTRVHRQLRA